jgi:hypothetical protein
MRMTRDQEIKLLGALESHITFGVDPPGTDGCANDHHLTRAFLTREGLDVETELAALVERGGACCDCEVVLNAKLGA